MPHDHAHGLEPAPGEPADPRGAEDALALEEPDFDADLRVEVAIDPCLSLAMQQNGISVVRWMCVENASPRPVEGLSVRIGMEEGFAEPFETTIGELGPEATWNLDNVDLELAVEPLLGLEEGREVTVWAEIHHRGELLLREEWPVEVLAPNEWGGLRSLPEVLAAFVQPRSGAVDQLVGALKLALEGRGLDSTFWGYHAPERVPDILEALWEACRDRGLGLSTRGASSEEGSAVRSPDELLEGGLGSELDLALLFASVVERIGLHPLLLLTSSGTCVGVWNHDESFPQSVVESAERLVRRVEGGELTWFGVAALDAEDASWTEALRAAEAAFADPEAFLVGIDVQAARREGILPLSGAVHDEHGESEVEEDLATPEKRIDNWKRRLLDLTLRNRFLNFRASSRSIGIECPDPSALAVALAGGQTFDVLPRTRVPSGKNAKADARERQVLEELKAYRLHAAADKKDLQKRLLEVQRTATLSLEETGANTLYLSIGFLAWRDRIEPSKEILAPILLLPVFLERPSVSDPFRIRMAGAEPRLNVTLLEKLRSELKLDVSSLEAWGDDERGFDAKGIFERWRAFAASQPNWEVRDEACVSIFSFTKFLMWRDLDDHADLLMRNPVVRYIMERPEEAFDDGTFPDPASFDERPPGDLFLPLDADGSQIAAIMAAEAGKSFVLEGPPGTGKSQTITNLIAHLLGQGKRVLFVAEKNAALTVVHDRLAAIGLGPFCLKLFSGKSGKQEVLEQLREALEATATAPSEVWQERARRLAEVRLALKNFVDDLHGVRPLGRSVYEVLSRVVALRDLPRIRLAVENPEGLDAEQFFQLVDQLDRLVAAAQALGDPSSHELRAVERVDWEIGLSEEVAASVHGVRESWANVAHRLTRAAPVLGLVEERTGCVPELSLFDLELLAEAGRHVLDPPALDESLLDGRTWGARRAELLEWIERGTDYKARHEALLAGWNESLLQADLPALLAQVDELDEARLLSAWKQRRALEPALAPHCRGEVPEDLEAIRTALQSALLLRAEDAQISGPAAETVRTFGARWQGARSDWGQVQEAFEWCDRFHRLAEALGGKNQLMRQQVERRWRKLVRDAPKLAEQGYREDLMTFAEALARFLRTWEIHAELLQLDERRVFDAPNEPGFAERITDYLDGWESSYPMLRDWCHYQRVRAEAMETPLAPIVEACDKGVVHPFEAGLVFEKSFYEGWLTRLLATDEGLADFHGSEHARKVQRFRELDTEWIRLTGEILRARLAASIPSPGEGTTTNSELGTLQRETRKKRKVMPVRTLFDKMPTLLPRLKPCVLMSPLSTAQFLTAGMQSFDVVVFDEASQIPVWDAVGAISRGQQVVVVGDSKQLPPTNFFTSLEEEDEIDDDDFEELDSLLEECIASHLPTMRLEWHYRSRHESLIAFSNWHYYGNRLATFPSPSADTSTMGVSFKFVEDGRRDSDDATNAAEAKAVVAEVVARLKALGHPKKAMDPASLGIVTFSINQQQKVEQLLDAAREKHKEIDPWFTNAVAEPVFVKNLESVQGDERDVILLGVGFGPDGRGRLSMNFGPLNREGGERRLNVAITRARRELVVFSSIRAKQVDLARTKAVGARHLKAFLDYAERGQAAISEAFFRERESEFDSAIQKEVHDRLTERGHAVDLAVGCSEHRLDLAIRHPQDPSRYVLGIELDGPAYRAAATVRDRDRLRPMVLTGLGWRLHRVFSFDWWQEPTRELEKIEAALKEALRAEAGVPRVKMMRVSGARRPSSRKPAEPESTAEASRAPDGTEPAETLDTAPELPVYRAFEAEPAGTPEDFASDEGAETVLHAFAEVIAHEGPVHFVLATRRVAERFGVQRVGLADMRRLRNLLDTVPDEERPLERDAFLWPAGTSPEGYRDFRTSEASDDSVRSADELPVEEVANAALHVLRQNVGMSPADLATETARLFGFRHLAPPIEERIQRGIEHLAGRGDALLDDELVRLPDAA